MSGSSRDTAALIGCGRQDASEAGFATQARCAHHSRWASSWSEDANRLRVPDANLSRAVRDRAESLSASAAEPRHFFIRCGWTAGYDALLIARKTGGPVASFECDPKCGLSCVSFALNDAPIVVVDGTVGEDIGLDDSAYGAGFVPDSIKIDVDGGEAAALQSATRLLADRRPALVVEVHSEALEAECGALLLDHGYRPVIVNQRLVWPDLRPIDHNRWLVAS